MLGLYGARRARPAWLCALRTDARLAQEVLKSACVLKPGLAGLEVCDRDTRKLRSLLSVTHC